MKITLLYDIEGKSFFKDVNVAEDIKSQLGIHSVPYPALHVIFREFNGGEFYDWHNAPRLQFIIYLQGQVKVVTSSDYEKVFYPGDIMLAADFEGKGHTTETLTPGKSLIIPCEDHVLTMLNV